jgi:aldehyde dehydrogenase (NAD+)
MKQHFIDNRWVAPASGESIPSSIPPMASPSRPSPAATPPTSTKPCWPRRAYEGAWGKLSPPSAAAC